MEGGLRIWGRMDCFLIIGYYWYLFYTCEEFVLFVE